MVSEFNCIAETAQCPTDLTQMGDVQRTRWGEQMNRMAGTQRSPFLAEPGCKQGCTACWLTRNPFLHICSSGVQDLAHADTARAAPGNSMELF